MTDLTKAWDKMEDARRSYAETWAEDYGSLDWANANEYRDEGYALAEQAFDMPEEDREDWLEGQFYAFPESARYLIAVSADYRLLELVAEDAKKPPVAPRTDWLAVAASITGASQ